jgi:Archaeal Type IV pilin, N-terminal
MKAILREERSGVAEVIGTILILSMTVVLFSVIIVWVSSTPTPTAQTRVDMTPSMVPIFNALGTEIGVNITMTHGGGEALMPVPTLIYVADQQGSGPTTTDVLTLHLYNGRLANPNGLLDGTDSVWNIGERWNYKNFADRSSDNITVSIVDTSRGLIVWSGPVNPAAGSRPPVFVRVWTDGLCRTIQPTTPQNGLGFCLYAQVMDPDGDLNPSSVYATITAWLGSGTVCSQPLQMLDNGVSPDKVAGDGIFSLGKNVCMNPPFPSLSWAGSFILLTATDLAGHRTTYRTVLNVVPATSGGGGGNSTTIPSQLWQYIGFVQVKTGDVWVTNLNEPTNTPLKFQPYRINRTTLNGDGGPLFQVNSANHGNRTIFVDGWTLMSFSKETSSSVFGMFIVNPINLSKPANAGGLGPYPGSSTDPTIFAFTQVLDCNPLNQETGGPVVDLLFAAKTAFKADWPQSFVANNLFVHILVSGMEGPANMTYSQILARWGPTYNPYTHLNDADPTTRTLWYAQVIPFIGMTVY